MDETVSLKLFHLPVILDLKNLLCRKNQAKDPILERFQGKRKIVQHLETGRGEGVAKKSLWYFKFMTFVKLAARKVVLCQVGGQKERIGRLRIPGVVGLIEIDPRAPEKVRVEKVVIELLENRPKSF